MSREIKFRAWDGSRMVHFSDFSIGFEKSKKVKPYVYFKKDTFDGEVKLGNHEIMEFTGVKDKNGIEIYEGDILKGGMYKSYEVKYDGEECGWNIGCYVQHNYEIIGNIYQNAELL